MIKKIKPDINRPMPKLSDLLKKARPFFNLLIFIIYNVDKNCIMPIKITVKILFGFKKSYVTNDI